MPAFTRAQSLQNTAFLAALRRTGNARDAARTLGVHRATYLKRRASHPAFAHAWDAALAVAHATLAGRASSGAEAGTGQPGVPSPATPPAPLTVRNAGGRLQLRRATSGKLTPAARQRFLAALSATANVRLSAAAAGASHSAFYALRRRDPGFAREMRLALQTGYERLECALLAGFHPDAHQDDAWRHNEPPEMPRMSPAQALQLLHLHQKEARFWSDRPDLRPRRGESTDEWSARAAATYRAMLARDCEDQVLRAVLRADGAPAQTGEPPLLPALDQVTGWSKATGTVHDPDVALFGGWRLG